MGGNGREGNSLAIPPPLCCEALKPRACAPRTLRAFGVAARRTRCWLALRRAPCGEHGCACTASASQDLCAPPDHATRRSQDAPFRLPAGKRFTPLEKAVCRQAVAENRDKGGGINWKRIHLRIRERGDYAVLFPRILPTFAGFNRDKQLTKLWTRIMKDDGLLAPAASRRAPVSRKGKPPPPEPPAPEPATAEPLLLFGWPSLSQDVYAQPCELWPPSLPPPAELGFCGSPPASPWLERAELCCIPCGSLKTESEEA